MEGVEYNSIDIITFKIKKISLQVHEQSQYHIWSAEGPYPIQL